MKRLFLLKKALYAVLLFMAIACITASPQKMMSVTVQQTQARATPTFLGKIVADLAYGDRLEVVGEQESWVKVIVPGSEQEGWVHVSALTTKRILLKAGDTNVSQTASSSEVALAGKGFNEQVEARYREETQLDYTWVDRMEGFTISWEKIQAFLEEGDLEPLEGGR